MGLISNIVYTIKPGNTPIASCIVMWMRSHMFIIVDYDMCLLLHLFSCHLSNVVFNNIVIIHAVPNISLSTNSYCGKVGNSLGWAWYAWTTMPTFGFVIYTFLCGCLYYW